MASSIGERTSVLAIMSGAALVPLDTFNTMKGEDFEVRWMIAGQT